MLPITGAIRIVTQAGQRERLSAAVTAGGGRPTASSSATVPAIDTPAIFSLEIYGTELVIEPAPPGTHGYDDLRRDAAAIHFDEDLEVMVGSLVDLVRIAEASEDRARVPALRRTLELTAILPAARAV